MASPKTKGRMLNKDISDSKKFAALSPQAAVLFCMMVPHYSAHGKMNGDPGYVKGEICPRIPYLTIGNIPKYLKEINDKTSVKWFEHDERWWIHSVKFLSDHQSLAPERMGEDKLPSYSGLSPELVPPEVEVEVKEEVEGEGKAPGKPGLSDSEYIDLVKGEYNQMMDDPKETAEWRSMYNGTMDIDRTLYAACTWLVDNPHRRKTKLRQFYGNWLRNNFQRASP